METAMSQPTPTVRDDSRAGASPFHPGEQAMQERAGVRMRAEQMGRHMIRDFMPDQHRELFARLPYIVVGSLDARQRPWASLMAGAPGFIASPDPWTLTVAAQPIPGDPLSGNIAAGAPIGLLGIELQTRRRNRMNGRIADIHDGRFAVRVDQSFGNCPQYIQARSAVFAERSAGNTEPAIHREREILSERASALVARADTFFIATASAAARAGGAAEGIDISHRGGKPGFVRLTEHDGRTLLTAPDFRGNNAFNTFGNIAVNPRAGLLFADFETGDLLLLTGQAAVLWDGPDLAAFAGARRLLRFEVAEGFHIERAMPLRWSPPDYAPQLLATGSWSDPAADEN
jgi:predicted pyridoxine 5'-phosphate oxidase superfamily flavin-nucleotide-binding protein